MMLLIALLSQLALAADYPAHWWTPVPAEGAPSWEVLPQAGTPGKSVILSKRHELGLLSNFAATPFTFHGKRYASLEGFWQAMLYPENADDPRTKGVTWKHTRAEVEQMTAFVAKAAGDEGYENMKKLGIDWVSFEGKRMKYWTPEKGEHYRLIVEAMHAKVEQNENVRKALLSTGDLRLLPDHHQPEDAPPSWRYYEIWMGIRGELRPAAQR